MQEKPNFIDQNGSLPIRELDEKLMLWQNRVPEKPEYRIKEKDDVKLAIILDYPDSFSLVWPTNISIDDFFKQTSLLIDKLTEKKHINRPLETGPTETIIPSPLSGTEEQTETTFILPPSYSSFGYNNVRLRSKTDNISPEDRHRFIKDDYYDYTPFDKLRWPLQFSNIVQTDLHEPSVPPNFPTSADELFARVNAEFCTLFHIPPGHNSLLGNREIMYWSHIADIDLIYDTYKETASDPIPEKIFKNALVELIPAHFQKN